MRRLSRVLAASHCDTGVYRGGPQKGARRKEDTEDKESEGGKECKGGTEGIGGITVTAVMAATVVTVGMIQMILI